MQRPSLWPLLVVLLLGLLFLREPRFQRFEETYLNWLARNSLPSGPPIPLTVVEIENPSSPKQSSNQPRPLEISLFLQGLLDFQPTVVAIAPAERICAVPLLICAFVVRLGTPLSQLPLVNQSPVASVQVVVWAKPGEAKPTAIEKTIALNFGENNFIIPASRGLF